MREIFFVDAQYKVIHDATPICDLIELRKSNSCNLPSPESIYKIADVERTVWIKVNLLYANYNRTSSIMRNINDISYMYTDDKWSMTLIYLK